MEVRHVVLTFAFFVDSVHLGILVLELELERLNCGARASCVLLYDYAWELGRRELS
jgi:hypothetical protein